MLIGPKPGCRPVLIRQRDGGAVTLAFCWSHWRREFFDIDKGGGADRP
jgi:hypothetical protein